MHACMPAWALSLRATKEARNKPPLSRSLLSVRCDEPGCLPAPSFVVVLVFVQQHGGHQKIREEKTGSLPSPRGFRVFPLPKRSGIASLLGIRRERAENESWRTPPLSSVLFRMTGWRLQPTPSARIQIAGVRVEELDGLAVCQC